jgi:glycosyltransferase involved in cell wall biosynthesis
MDNTPRVTVIVPCYNEEKTIGGLLQALARQTFPISQMEILILDGISVDRTLETVAEFSQGNGNLQVRVVPNPKRIIPAALNLGIQEARGEFVIRLDAHSVPHPEYVARSVSGLEQHLGDNVGGVWKIVPSNNSWIARSIAAAAAHPLAVGDAKYRYADTPGEVDTVPFGAFRREYIQQIGGFDETLLTNEDYELNTRIRLSGGKLWLDPNIQVQYYSRSNLGQLARQYARYGFWKVAMLKRYPKSLRWRQAMPPLFVLGVIGLSLLSLWFPPALWLLGVILGVYAMALLLSGIDLALQANQPGLLFGVPLAILVMHFTWGGAFLFGLVRHILVRKSDG